MSIFSASEVAVLNIACIAAMRKPPVPAQISKTVSSFETCTKSQNSSVTCFGVKTIPRAFCHLLYISETLHRNVPLRQSYCRR